MSMIPYTYELDEWNFKTNIGDGFIWSTFAAYCFPNYGKDHEALYWMLSYYYTFLHDGPTYTY